MFTGFGRTARTRPSGRSKSWWCRSFRQATQRARFSKTPVRTQRTSGHQNFTFPDHFSAFGSLSNLGPMAPIAANTEQSSRSVGRFRFRPGPRLRHSAHSRAITSPAARNGERFLWESDCHPPRSLFLLLKPDALRSLFRSPLRSSIADLILCVAPCAKACSGSCRSKWWR